MLLSNSQYFIYDEQLSQDGYVDYGGYDVQSKKVEPAQILLKDYWIGQLVEH